MTQSIIIICVVVFVVIVVIVTSISISRVGIMPCIRAFGKTITSINRYLTGPISPLEGRPKPRHHHCHHHRHHYERDRERERRQRGNNVNNNRIGIIESTSGTIIASEIWSRVVLSLAPPLISLYLALSRYISICM